MFACNDDVNVTFALNLENYATLGPLPKLKYEQNTLKILLLFTLFHEF